MHRLSHCSGLSYRAQALVQAQQLWLPGSRAQAQSFHSRWDLPRSGIEPVTLVLAGGFFTTEPPGKPLERFWQLCCPSSVDTWRPQDGPCGDTQPKWVVWISVKGRRWLSGLPSVSLLPESVVGFLFLNSSSVRWGQMSQFLRVGQARVHCVISVVPSCVTGLCVGHEPQCTPFSISDQSDQQPTIQFWSCTKWQEEEKAEDGPNRS